MSDIVKFDKIIPVGKQQFAYQCENISHVVTIEASVPWRGGNLPYDNDEKELLREYKQYELSIFRHTGNSMIVDLRKFYKDGKVELFTTTMSFSDLVNQIFKNLECSLIVEKESKPAEVNGN